jgi:hypothetical protein
MRAKRVLFFGNIPIGTNHDQQNLLLRFLQNKFIARLSKKPKFFVDRSIFRKSSHGLNLFEHTIYLELLIPFRDLR